MKNIYIYSKRGHTVFLLLLCKTDDDQVFACTYSKLSLRFKSFLVQLTTRKVYPIRMKKTLFRSKMHPIRMST